jgi:pyruvate ferredoxin oxidoreductase beta subunit
MEKVTKGAEVDGPAYVHVFSVCPTGWRSPPEETIEIGRLAVQTGVFPLYEIEDGKYKLSVKVAKRKPVQDYLKLQGRFRHLSDKEIKVIQDRVDSDYDKLIEQVEKDKKQV